MKLIYEEGGRDLLLKEAFEKYFEKLNSENSTTSQTYGGKVKKYVKLHHNEDIYNGLSIENLQSYIFKDDQKCLHKYNALLNFYDYVFKDLLNKDDIRFPIKRNDVIKLDEEREKNTNYIRGRKASSVSFLPDDFDFKVLFDSKYYVHLNNHVAETTIKAIIGLGLATGFDSQHFFENKTKQYIRLSDVVVNNPDEIAIVFISDTEFVTQISITGEYCKFLIDYLELRTSYKTHSDALFIKMWSGYELNYKKNIVKKMPHEVQNLVLYFLKYISLELKIPQLYITDLRYNMAYHYLLNTKGSALNEIIRLYGYPPFVQLAYKKFISKIHDETYYSFDFFNLASSAKTEHEIDGVPDEADSRTAITILEKRVRNSSKVKKIKEIYDNKCQICNLSITLLANFKYSEVHHIQPIGKDHKGADELHNMIVLCPNHHALFDLGVIAINPMDSNTLIHIDSHNPINMKPIKIKHSISHTCIRYHYDNIFLPLSKALVIKK